jgi:hypothetical protein
VSKIIRRWRAWRRWKRRDRDGYFALAAELTVYWPDVRPENEPR